MTFKRNHSGCYRENRKKVNTNESMFRCCCFSPGERFMVACMGVEERI